jgi:outer membrane protein assembly factor BamD (BamD/ComL family)
VCGRKNNPPKRKLKHNLKPRRSHKPNKREQMRITDHFYKKYVTAIKWNDFEVAKSALYDLIMENPQNDSLILSLAYHYYENQQHVPAVLVSQELLARNPKNT